MWYPGPPLPCRAGRAHPSDMSSGPLAAMRVQVASARAVVDFWSCLLDFAALGMPKGWGSVPAGHPSVSIQHVSCGSCHMGAHEAARTLALRPNVLRHVLGRWLPFGRTARFCCTGQHWACPRDGGVCLLTIRSLAYRYKTSPVLRYNGPVLV